MSATTIAANQHFAPHKVSDTVITSTMDHHTAKQDSVESHPLRVLVVDDNVLNLTILTKLLRKRFSNVLDGAPIAVDSALKALQLLRENVFDVILMDIQMPFLSGVDCTERIRAGQDGVLDANRHATIIAVTTATGSEPEQLYRKTGFDGIIGKPVKHEVLAACLTPLHAAATEARRQVPRFWLEGREMLPALPITPLSGDRAFFTPSANRDSPHAPAITLSHNFEGLLKQQTRVSLHRFGAYAISRTGTLPGASDRRRLRQYDVEDNDTHSPNNNEVETPSLTSSPSTGEEMALDSPSPGPFVGLTSSTSSPPHATVPFAAEDSSSTARPALHRRQASLTISQRGLQDQLQREIDAAQFDVKFANAVAGSSSLDAPFNMHRTLPKIQVNRAQRYSTPDALQFGTLLDGDYGGDANATVKSTHGASQAAHKRPGLPDGFALASPLDCNEDDYDTLSPLASPRHLYALMPPPPRRPGVYPRQKAIEGERRRSSADQSTTSSASTNDSSSRSGSVSTSSDSNMRSDSMVTETSDADQELDSPLTTPDTEYPPAHDDDDGDDDGTQVYCPFRLGALKHQLEEDLSMTPEKCSHADACVDDQYDYTGPAAVI